MHPMSELQGDFRELQVIRDAGTPGMERLTWIKRAVYLALNRAPHRTGFVPAGDAHWWHVSTFERAVVTDMSEQGFRVRTRDRKLALELTKRGVHTFKRFVKEGPAAARRYKAAMPTLTSRANWARLYGLDD
jgi:galactofuranosylgalactofuranosylrhamnosyl-N-acetylglucosaminyl-diphospho-decaprenol beta-1,5/1,6-galactofuranosyltransferase